MKRYSPSACKTADDQRRIHQVDHMIRVDVGIRLVNRHIPTAGQEPTQNNKVFQGQNAVAVRIACHTFATDLANVRLKDLRRQIQFQSGTNAKVSVAGAVVAVADPAVEFDTAGKVGIVIWLFSQINKIIIQKKSILF